MSKNATIIFRLSEIQKIYLAKAARNSGKTLTNFILEAALSSAKKSEIEARSRSQRACDHDEVFYSLCEEAMSGGAGYEIAGNYFGKNFYRFLHPHMSKGEISKLKNLISAKVQSSADLKKIISVLQMPTSLVPKRRQKTFISGVKIAFLEMST